MYALASRPDCHSPRQVRHLDYISQFTSDLRHVKGTAADALSRLSALHTDNTSVVDFRELALAQVNDPDLPQLRTDSSLRVPFLSEGISIVCYVSTGIQRP